MAAAEMSVPTTVVRGSSRGKSQCNRTAARSEVEYPCLLFAREVGQGEFDDEFGLGPWNEHVRRDLERQRPEFLLAEHVGHRFAVRSAA